MIQSLSSIKKLTQKLSNQDEMMAKLIAEFGVPTFKPWLSDPFTSLIASITSQQLSTKAAQTIYSRVAQQFSLKDISNAKNISKNNSLLDVKKLAQTNVDTLRACGLSNSKAHYCIGIALAVFNEELRFEDLKKMPPEEAAQTLIQLKGVGNWTAEMFLIFALGHKDIFAVDDLGLKKAVQSLFNLKSLPDKKKMLECSQNWSPYRSIASWYLWRHLESD